MKFILASWLSAAFFCVTLPARATGPEAMARAYNEFGFRLLAQCRQSLSKTNCFLSPSGLAFALSMLQNGAQGETLRQILATLQVGNTVPSQLNESNRALLQHLVNLDSKVAVEIANAIWIDQKAAIKPEFISVNRRGYNAEVANGDFQNPATVKQINDWVSAGTHGKIPDILEAPLDPMLRLILLNAIYFKGDWLTPFDTHLTRAQPFTPANGQAVAHPRMSRTGSYAYGEDDRVQVVELPYAGGEISMVVFLPKGSLDEFLNKFAAADFEATLAGLRVRNGTVELPRFKLEDSYDLTGVLAALGMPTAFSTRADFSGMSAEPLYISLVKQKTYVSVDEKGTEAAAVTVVAARGMIARREPPPFHFVVDRPFFLAIRDKQSGLILFLGTISDPR